MANLKRFLHYPYLHVVVLTAIVWLVFARTVGSYFLADDFGEVSYACRIFNGEYNLLWSDFTSNFMQVPGMAVWRPWLMVSLLIDYCIWHANPVGYYLTNVLSYNLVVLLFYFLINSLSEKTHEDENGKGRLVALLSAGLFAVSPLHCESISWVVGRVDVVCALFYLACLNLSLLAERLYSKNQLRSYRLVITAAVICFWLGMWTKEMAIGAPVMVTTIYLLFGSKPLNLKYSLRVSAPLWFSTISYFIMRYLALGTLLGGYVQGIGDSQAANALSRWLDPDTLKRLFFPFAYSLFGEHSWQQGALQLLYTVMVVLVIFRLLTSSITLRWLALILVWIFTCLAPLYKLWGLGYELEGARFCFFLTMPLSLMAPSLIIMEGKGIKLQARINNAITIIGTTSAVLALLILSKTAYRTNLEWVHAGKEVRSVLKQAQALSKETSSEDKILVLGVPKRRGGAHMILNGATFTTGLRPPFTIKDYSLPFVTFDPLQFAESPYINSDRLKKLLAQDHKLVVWNSEQSRFNGIKFEQNNSAAPKLLMANAYTSYPHRLGGVRTYLGPLQGLALSNIREGDSLAFSALQLNPLSADFLEVDLTILDAEPRPIQLAVSINDKDSSFYKSKPISKAALETFRVPLSRDWHWYEKSKIDSLYILLPPGRNLEINECRLIKAEAVAPSLDIQGVQSNDGVVSIPRKNLQEKYIEATVTLPQMVEAEQIQIEISKANSFFENFPNNNGEDAVMLRQNVGLKSRISTETKPKTVKILVNCQRLNPDFYYQLRARLLNGGRVVGEHSNPVTVRL